MRGIMDRTGFQICRALEKRPMSFWELIRSQDATLSEFTRTIRQMLSEKAIAFDAESRKFSLNKDKAERTRLGSDGRCDACDGTGIAVDGPLRGALDRFLELTADRPSPIFEYNQGIIAPRDLVRKFVFMDRRGDMEGRSILLIGDDDLFCILLALLGLETTLTVLEIDERLIAYIREKAKHHDLKITARRYDVNTPLPQDLSTACDVFVTEPPEGLRGMLLFLERGIGALRMQGAGYFGLTTLESSLPKWLAIQRFLLEKKMVVTDLLRNFSVYPEIDDPIQDYAAFPISQQFPVDPGLPDVDFFRSCLVRVEKTKLEPLKETGTLYTDEDTSVTVNPEHQR